MENAVLRVMFALALVTLLLAPPAAMAGGWDNWGGGGDDHRGHDGGHKPGHGGAPLPLLAAGIPGVLALAGGVAAYRRGRAPK